MADEQAGTPPAAEQAQDAGQPENAAQTNAAGGGQQPERTFTQAELEQIVAERLGRERKQSESKAQRAREEAERKAAEEQGEFRKLYEMAQAKADAAEQRARELELAGMRRDAAAKLGLPSALADRLKGETPEELEADAKTVLAALPKPAAPNINATGGGAQGNGALWSEEERKRLAALYRVSPKNFGTVAGD